jgi:hypothetical protein
MEICDVELSGNYEEKMLINNNLENIPTAEIREIDNEKSIFYKIDGLCVLSTRYGRCVPDRNEIDSLIADLIDCIREIKEYLLNPDGLVINSGYILYDEKEGRHKFMYVPGYKKEFRLQIKTLFEEIMRMFNHGDREGVIYLYDLYSSFLMDNFTPEMFCKMRPEHKLLEKNPDYDSEIKKKQVDDFYESEPQEVFEEEMYGTGKTEKEHKDHSLYFLASAAAIVVAVVMYIFFGVSSLKFSGLTFVALAVFVLVDMLHKKSEEEMEESMKSVVENEELMNNAMNNEEHNKKLEENYFKGVLANELVNRDLNSRDISPREAFSENTSVLAVRSNADGISKLVPCDENKNEIYLIEGETRIGRSGSSCDYLIDDPSVSRVHVIIEKHGQEVTLIDVGSTNGTYINDTKVTNNEEEKLSHGDLISFANVRYKCV